MAVQYKKLLPKIMQNTRWGDFVDVYQSIIQDVKSNKIDPILKQNTQYASYNELINLAYFYGFNLLTLSGYTQTEYYLKKQIETLVKRVKYKTNKKSYYYTSYVYDLISSVYPMTVTSVGTLIGKLTTLYDPASQIKYAVEFLDPEGDNLLYYITALYSGIDETNFTSLDSITTLDEQTPIYDSPRSYGLQATTLDSDTFLSLDPATSGAGEPGKGALITNITRNILYSYYHKFLENSTEWMSSNTLQVLKNDIDQIHKATEVIYYEPHLRFNTQSGIITNQVYTNYNQTTSGVVESILLTGKSLIDAGFIQFGVGKQTSLSGMTSGVQTFSYYIPSGIVCPSGCVISGVPSGVGGWNFFENPAPNKLHIDFIISEKNMFTEFSEMAVLDHSSGCLFYASFPTIKWDYRMYNNIQLEITIV